jgi:high-affinity iron transporter
MINLNVAMVMWRELFEALLVVVLIFGILAKRVPRRQAYFLSLIGLGGGITISILLGTGLLTMHNLLSSDTVDLFQAGMLLISAGFMTHMCIWMKKNAHLLKQNLGISIDHAYSSTGILAIVGTISFAVAREGFEIVIFLSGILASSVSLTELFVSIAFGLFLTVASGICMMMGLKIFSAKWLFSITGAFLLLTAASFVLGAVQILIQRDLLVPIIEPIWDSSAFLDESTWLGRAVVALTGYQSRPALVSVLAYCGYWLTYFAVTRQFPLAEILFRNRKSAGLLVSGENRENSTLASGISASSANSNH